MSRSVAKEKWESGLTEEVDFWTRWLAGKTEYGEDRTLRLTPNRELPWWVIEKLPADQAKVRILDVGAGPVAAFGDRWDGHEVELVPIDPLAETFDRILEANDLTPPVRTLKGFGEKLVEQFGENSFDFAYACNCLDHSLDPIQCYQQMLEVLRPGRALVTYHAPNEAEHQGYDGLHQWNFEMREVDGEKRVIVWNRDFEADLVDSLEGLGGWSVKDERGYVRLTLRKAE
jgi:SAM-dependent methyltransferase